MKKQHHEPIAIVGVSALFPGSLDHTGFWHDILKGRDLLSDVPASHWLIEDYYDPDPTKPDKTYAKRGAFLPDVDFDPMEWGVPPSIVPQTDTTQLLALIVAHKVLDDACGGQFSRIDRSRVSCVLGVTSGQELMGSMVSRLQRPVWVKALREAGLPESKVNEVAERISGNYTKWEEANFPGLLGNVVAGRIANRLDLGGTNAVTDAACASTFSAVSMAVNELSVGQSDLVIAGGCDTMNDIFMYMCFSKTPALSASGDCRPFSDKADGTMLGEGLGMVALKRLSDAEAAGDRIYGVIRGVGSSSDGRAKSVYAPLPAGQAKAIRRAYEVAGWTADTVELIEAHGTGTKAGDAAEFEGLRMVFDEAGTTERQWCALGSVKSQIGHTKSAAGAAGLIKAVLALHHKVLPPTIKVDAPNPKLSLESSPFYLSTEARPWVRKEGHPRRAGVSAFGFGGSNFHVAVEEYLGPADAAWRTRSSDTDLVVLRADDAQAVAADARAMATEVEKAIGEGRVGMLRFLARSTQDAFVAKSGARLSIVATDERDLITKLRAAADEITGGAKSLAKPNGIYFEQGAHEGTVGFLFPGQGSQYVGMGAGLAMGWDEARGVWDRAASMSLGDASLHEIVFPRPVFDPKVREEHKARLTRTENAQPGIGAASLAALRVLEKVGVLPSAVAGHSFGEVVALHAAGAISEADVLRIARQRGERMAEAARTTEGAMSAVIADRARVEGVLRESGLPVVIANHNAPDQAVISGTKDAIAKAEELLRAQKITCKRLDVATAFHSPVVAAAAAPFAKWLDAVEVKAPKVAVYADATAQPYPADVAGVRSTLGGQLAQPVRFVEIVEAMYAAGVRTFVEVGPGSVLTGLVSKILAGRPHRAIATDRKGTDAATSLDHALARLAAAGLPVALGALWAAYAPAHDPRSTAKPRMTLKINGSNYGKPYPPKGGAAALPPPNPEKLDEPRIEIREVERVVEKVVEVPVYVQAPDATSQQYVQQHQGSSMSQNDGRVPPAPESAQLAWIAAYQEAQKQTAEAHSAFQRAMADAHGAFLRSAETSFVGLATMLSASPAIGSRQDHAQFESLRSAAPVMPAMLTAPVAPTAAAPAFAAPLGSMAGTATPTSVSALPAPTPTYAPAVVAAPVVAASVAAAPAAPSVDLMQTMLEVVAAKTGYPVEMIQMGMELEADLGIDSIKRVEILAAVREKAPGLPDMDPAQLGALRTVGEIVEHLKKSLPASASSPAPGVAAPVAPAAQASSVDLMATMLEVVAAKTGYPSEMIRLDMELEADLGIDSIKRVEILAAVREQAPGLPDMDPAQLGALRTVGEIVDHLKKSLPGGAAVAASTPAPSPAASAKKNDAERWVTVAAPSPAIGMVRPGLLSAKKLVITDDGTGIAAALVPALAARGRTAEVVRDVPADADAVIFLGGLRDAKTVEQQLAVNREAFQAAKRFAAGPGKSRGAFVTVQDTGGDFGLSGSDRAWLGGLSALAKTAAQEWPEAAVRAIDLARAGRPAAVVAEILADELVRGGPELEVGLEADGTRVTLVSEPIALTGSASVLAKGDVVVASGGARGVTAATLIALAKASQCRLVLLGRTALEDEPAAAKGHEGDAALKRALLEDAKKNGQAIAPAELGKKVEKILANREVRATIAAIQAAGGDARYVPTDVQDAAAVSKVLADVRASWGPIAAIVHGAGVLADRFIADKTDEQFDRVFDTKVQGLRALLAATASDPLKAVVMFSSVAARCGNQGQCDYAMANEVLNKVACSLRRERGIRVRSLGWGPWEGGMVTPALKARFEKLGVPLIALADGARMLVDELATGSGEAAFPGDVVEVVLGGEPKAEALAADHSTQTARALDVVIDESTHPFIASHVVKGTPVLPAVMVMELFARAARERSPELVVSAVRDVKVLRGVRLQKYGQGGDRFTVTSTLLANGSSATYEMALVGEPGPDGQRQKHYTARVEMLPALVRGAPAPQMTGLAPWQDIVYGDVLFHGPMFHAITGLEGSSESGIAGELIGKTELGWSAEHAWATDPALLDGGLQLAVLWTKHALGGASLPTSIGAYVPHREGVVGPFRAIATGKAKNRDQAVFDVVFADASGATVARLESVEVSVLPGSRQELAGAGRNRADA